MLRAFFVIKPLTLILLMINKAAILYQLYE